MAVGADIRVEALLHVELHFVVLAHLDLGDDAASLFDARLPARPWVEPLRRAYLAAPGRVTLHGLPLWADDLDSLVDLLRSSATGPTDGDRTLCSQMIDAVEAERPALELGWSDHLTGIATRLDEIRVGLTASLTRLRDALWGDRSPTPVLEVIHCAALALGGRTRGRAVQHRGRVRVAACVTGALDDLVCQLLHEEVHQVTDPPVRALFATEVHETDPTRAGFALHQVLERTAIDRGAELVAEYAPELEDAYTHWRRRWGYG